MLQESLPGTTPEKEIQSVLRESSMMPLGQIWHREQSIMTWWERVSCVLMMESTTITT